MFFRRYVTQHCGPEPANHRSPDSRGYMIIARGDVRSEWAKRVERSFLTTLELLVHVLFDQVHRHMAGTFDHYLAIVLPGNLRQFAQRLQLCKLRFVVRSEERRVGKEGTW